MTCSPLPRPVRLTLVIPCYNEEKTLRKCIDRVLKIRDENLSLELVIVDDGSRDRSLAIARELALEHPEIVVVPHEVNQGKGAALRTGFQKASGEFVGVQDADLEYDPRELESLLLPLVNDEADVVFGSRFLSCGAHRVLYFWHFLGNSLLTFVSNMFSDLNLTDMETCYKIFRRDVVQSIDIKENRFGVEPELVAKVARMRLRIYETGISYYGRTYEEGKKIGFRDAFRAFYCIFRYNAPTAPPPVQFLLYLFIGGFSAAANLLFFLALLGAGSGPTLAAALAFAGAAAVNYLLCIAFLFRHKARWNSTAEVLVYLLVVVLVGALDVGMTRGFLFLGLAPWLAKSVSSIFGLVFNFLGRRYLVFPEKPAGPWKPQVKDGE